MQTKSLLASLAAVTVAGSAAAVSPYDVAYAPQWNYLAEGANDERNGAIAASSDSSAWFMVGHSSYTGANFSPWGDQGNGGSWDSAYGQLSPLGTLVQAKSLPNITGYTDENQSYTRQNFSMQGTSAMLGWDGRSTAFWAGEPLGSTPGGDFMTVKIAPDGTESFKTTTQLLTTNLRNQAAVSSQNDNTTWFVGGYQGGAGVDVVTAGDGSLPALSPSYSPYIGRKDAAGNLSGPTKQSNTDGRSYYNSVDVNDATNRVFVAGFSYDASGGISTYWDVDGDGVADHTTPGGKTDPSFGIVAVYDATTLAVVGSATMNSDFGDDWFFDVAATPDGGFVATGRTKGSMAGYTNPSSGVNDDIYLAKYDATGTLVWDYQSETAVEDEGVDVSVDSDGNIYLGSRIDVVRTNAANNSNAPVGSGRHAVTKFDSAGNIVWHADLNEAGTLSDLMGSDAVSKNKVYVAAETNPDLGAVYSNINGYTDTVGDDRELLVQKLVPGDFNVDAVVNQADVDLADAAVDPVLAATDTYDFDEDGTSDRKDISYWWFNILDNTAGDVDGDGDVDGVDVSAFFSGFTGPGAGPNPNVALGNYDLDLDGDGDTDGVDLASVFSAFTGPLGPANVPEPTSLALLGLGGLLAARRRRA